MSVVSPQPVNLTFRPDKMTSSMQQDSYTTTATTDTATMMVTATMDTLTLTKLTMSHLLSNLKNDYEAKNLAIWIVILFVFTIFEIFYGSYLDSLGLVSDGFHALFDCIGFAISLMTMLVGKKGSNREYTYGYDRWEILGVFSNGCFLLFVSFFLFLESFERMLEPPHMHRTGKILLQTTPETLQTQLNAAYEKSAQLEGVMSLSDRHFWTHSHGNFVGSITVHVKADADEQLILKYVRNNFAFINNLTVQVEKEH
eukprot:gene1131-1293_t